MAIYRDTVVKTNQSAWIYCFKGKIHAAAIKSTTEDQTDTDDITPKITEEVNVASEVMSSNVSLCSTNTSKSKDIEFVWHLWFIYDKLTDKR